MQNQSKRDVKIREYQSMAKAAVDMAQGAQLENVRHKYVQAAGVWTELAYNEEARSSRSYIVSPTPRMSAMNDDQKLTAIQRGVVGSYNLAAPRTLDAFVGLAFQHVAAQALGIARGRGYFHRKVMDGPKVDGLLVTIQGVVAVPARSAEHRRRPPISGGIA